jgi:hypothetical protein
MLGPVALVRADVSEEHISYIMRMTRIGELGTLAVTSNVNTQPRGTINSIIIFIRNELRLLVTAKVVRILPILVTLMMPAKRSTELSVFTGTTRHNIPRYGILHSLW